ncbi:MAG: epoxyqueuosine reductase QueH [Nitrospinota bacterium]|nr:epoxyqueuosine reductase QueH [Nitrospinota bacterium]
MEKEEKRPSSGVTDKPRLLLHICCAPCSAYVTRKLEEEYDLILYFHNPNIHPAEEYAKRRDEAKTWAQREGLCFMEEAPDVEEWFQKTSGLEGEPERGARCQVCFEARLSQAAAKAVELGVSYFGTVLSVSPHKDAAVINRVGMKLGEDTGLDFIEADFKKKDGFKLSMAKARQNGMYRQDYCGCVYSMKRARKAPA